MKLFNFSRKKEKVLEDVKNTVSGEYPQDKYAPWVRFYREKMQSFFYTPYIMLTQIPNFKSNLVNTDSYGFRHTFLENKKTVSPQGIDSDKKYNVLLGGSVTFGWGAAEGDIATIPSILSRETGERWLNMGVCGQTLQGNLITSLFFNSKFKSVNKLVFLGGFNEIAVFLNAIRYSATFGGIYEDRKYFNSMNNNTLMSYSDDCLRSQEFLIMDKSSNLSYRDFENSLDIAIETLAVISKMLGATPYYFLQPIPLWMDREHLPKEREILSWCMEQHSRGLKEGFYKNIKKAKKWYPSLVRKICHDKGIKFVDLNLEMSNKKYNEDWIFIDPAHLTDTGSKIVSEIIFSNLEGGQ